MGEKKLVMDYVKNMDGFPPINNPIVDLLQYFDDGIISEGYYKTYPVENVIKYIKQLFNTSVLSIHTVNIGNSSVINISIPIDYEYGELNKAMGLCGYYQSTKKQEENLVVVRYKPKYSDNFQSLVGEQKYLYHTSPIIFRDKILKNGLCPLSKNGVFEFPYRVYCFKGYDKDNNINLKPTTLINFAKQLRLSMLKMDEWEKDYKQIGKDIWLFYRIDVSLLPQNMKFYDDVTWPSNPFAIWTYENIPPKALEIIGKHDFRKNI